MPSRGQWGKGKEEECPEGPNELQGNHHAYSIKILRKYDSIRPETVIIDQGRWVYGFGLYFENNMKQLKGLKQMRSFQLLHKEHI